MNSVAKFGVLGVRSGVPGTRSLPVLEVPGRARPACSRCSAWMLDRLEGLFEAAYHHSNPVKLQ